MELYSISKGLWHLDRLKLLQEGKPIAPILIQVDTQAYCNDNCSFCSYRIETGFNNQMLELIDVKPSTDRTQNKPLGRPTKISGLPERFAYDLPKQMKQANIPAIEVTGGGEPTLWPHCLDLFLQCEKYGREFALVTNGSNMSEEMIEVLARSGTWCRFSMDASTPELHQKIHRTPHSDFERRINTLKKLISVKKRYENNRLIVGISFILTPDNYDDVSESALFYKKLGVDNIRFSWMYDSTGNAGLTEQQIEYQTKRLEQIKAKEDTKDFRIMFERGRIDTYSRPNDDFKTCYSQYVTWAIGADCKVYPCCIMKYDPGWAYADIREKTLQEIVSDAGFHKRQLELDPMGCRPCWLRNKNKAIAQGVEKPQHENFV